MTDWAYEFSCPKSLYEMGAMLTAAGPWQWGVRDCAFYPDYLQCRPAAGVRICVYEVNPPGGPAYRSYVEIRPPSPQERPDVEPGFRRLLGALPVSGLREIPATEWPFD
jgi:hypothetical protein